MDFRKKIVAPSGRGRPGKLWVTSARLRHGDKRTEPLNRNSSMEFDGDNAIKIAVLGRMLSRIPSFAA